MGSLQTLVANAPGVAARPDSIISLIEIIEDPVVEAGKLVPIVESDPGLTAGLLKLCNSPIYNFKRRIGSPREALVLVGNLTFARLCFTLSLEPILHRDLPGYNLDLDTLWQHSLGTAYGTAFLVKAIGRKDLRDRAFTAGLLHDIGKLVLDQEMATSLQENPDADKACIQDEGKAEVSERPVSLDLERRRTGHDHAEVGAALLEEWALPEQIVEAIRFHHDPLEAVQEPRLAVALYVADRVNHFATRFQSGSKMVEQWVESNFEGSGFPFNSIHGLAEIISTKHRNILSLATGPGL